MINTEELHLKFPFSKEKYFKFKNCHLYPKNELTGIKYKAPLSTKFTKSLSHIIAINCIESSAIKHENFKLLLLNLYK